MGFVKELVPLEGPEREWLDSFKFTYHDNNVKYEVINKDGRIMARSFWVIDREKKMFLINLGGIGWYGTEGLPSIKVLVINNKVISKIYTRIELQGDKEIGIKVRWNIETIVILKEYQGKSSEIIQLIVDALIAMGVAISSKNITPSEIKFENIEKPNFALEIDYE